jgi:hypothetical protein
LAAREGHLFRNFGSVPVKLIWPVQILMVVVLCAVVRGLAARKRSWVCACTLCANVGERPGRGLARVTVAGSAGLSWAVGADHRAGITGLKTASRAQPNARSCRMPLCQPTMDATSCAESG